MTPRRSMLALVLAASGVLGVAVSASGTSGGWGPPQRVATADDAADVHAGIDADGNAVVVWEAGGVWAAVRPQGLGRWQRSVRVSGKGVGIEAVDAAVNAAGDVVVAYLVVAGSGHRAEVVTGSTHGGWHRPRPLGSARCCAIGAGVDGRGFASVLFLGPERLTVASGNARAAGVPRIERLAVPSRLAQYPLLRVDERGDALAAWTRCVPGTKYPCKTGAASRFESSTRIAGSGVWSPPRLVAPAVGEDNYASRVVALTESGRAVAAWTNRQLWAATKPLFVPWRKPVQVVPENVFGDDLEDPAALLLQGRDGGRALLVWLGVTAGFGAASLDAGGVWQASQLAEIGPAPAAAPVVATSDMKAVAAWDVQSFLGPSTAAIGDGDEWHAYPDIGPGDGNVAAAAVNASGEAILIWASETRLESDVYQPSG